MSPKTIENDGIVDTIAGWAKRLGVSPQVINGRIRKGWTERKAVTLPLRQPLTADEREERREASVKKYLVSEKGKAASLRKTRTYEASIHGSAKRKAYRKTQARRDVQHRYNTSKKGRQVALDFAKTEKGKRNRRRFVESNNGKAYRLWNSARLRAAQNEIPFSMTRERVQKALEKGVCEVTGIPFNKTRKGRGPFTPSLDRIVPILGYTNENVQIVAWIYNAAKGDWTHDEVMKMVQALNAKNQDIERRVS